MKSILRIVVASLVTMIVAIALIWGFLAGRKEQAADAQREAPVEAPSRVTAENGETVLAFDPAAQRANGIVTDTLEQTRQSAETEATGVVLVLQPLLDLQASYSAASTNLARAEATARASAAEYERLRQLNLNGKNASDKAVEASRATAESDAAAVKNAEQALTILKSSTSLRWGPVVANWLEQGSPQLEALLTQREFLLQVTSVSFTGAAAPRQATVQYADGAHGVAHLVSALPQVDPRLQAPSLLYIVSSHPGLVPGINLPVFLPSGPAQDGVIVPSNAVVWWQGSAWCYAEESPGKFARRAVATSAPVSEGWFVSEGIDAHTPVVTSGAQILLSEEFRSQIQEQKEED